MKSMIRNIMGNSGIILGFVLITYLILDWYNQKMNFMGNKTSILLLGLMCLVSIVNGAMVCLEKKK